MKMESEKNEILEVWRRIHARKKRLNREFISNSRAGVRSRSSAGAMSFMQAASVAPWIAQPAMEPLLHEAPNLLMNSSSAPNFDELMNLFIKN